MGDTLKYLLLTLNQYFWIEHVLQIFYVCLGFWWDIQGKNQIQQLFIRYNKTRKRSCKFSKTKSLVVWASLVKSGLVVNLLTFTKMKV